MFAQEFGRAVEWRDTSQRACGRIGFSERSVGTWPSGYLNVHVVENPVKISVSLVWYNGMGGHLAISFAGDFLLLGTSESYGLSFDALEFYPHIPSEHRLPGLDFMSARFDKRIRELPKAWIKRKQRYIEVSYNSQLGTQEELVGEKYQVCSTAQFSLACHEIESALKVVEKRIQTLDDLKLDVLRTHFRERLQQLPRTEHELLTTLEQLRLAERQHLLP